MPLPHVLVSIAMDLTFKKALEVSKQRSLETHQGVSDDVRIVEPLAENPVSQSNGYKIHSSIGNKDPIYNPTEFTEMAEAWIAYYEEAMLGSGSNTQPVDIDLKGDEVAAERVVTNAARRVISQHRDEIEALAYK